MADSARVIHDTIYVKGADALDFLNKTNEFYNNAWDKLVLLVGIGGAIVGIIIPLVINFWQQRNLTLQRKKLRAELVKEFNNIMKKEIEILEADISIFKLSAEAGIIFVQGLGAMSTKQYKQACGDFLKALKCWCETQKNAENLKICISNISKVLPTLSAKDIYDIEREREANLLQLLEAARNIDSSLLTENIERALNVYKDVTGERDL